MVNKKKQTWLPLWFALAMIIGLLVGYILRGFSGGRNFLSASNNHNTIQEVVSLIKNKYVDEVKMDSINEITINELLSHLDPHSIYIPPVDVQAVNDDLTGNFQGIGVEFQLFDDTINIINVIKDGPSFKAGLQVGDKIIAVNDTVKMAGINIKVEDIRKNLRGEAGSKVVLTIQRNNTLKKINVERGNIPISTVNAGYMMENNIGYIKLNKFGEKTYEEFMQQLEALQKKGMKSLILDLRGNGGGLMNEAVDIADEFLDGHKLIVYTQGNQSERFEYKCKRDGLFETGKLAVLVDESSASASEVLAGALQDWDRATIIGRKTFGKGLVQQQYNLSDGGALRLTVSRYYSPLGRNIQKPYKNKSLEEYRHRTDDELADSSENNLDSTEIKQPAFKTPKGKIVYGGGGITPDVKVVHDTLDKNKKIVELYYSNLLNKIAYKIYLSNKTILETLSINDFIQVVNSKIVTWPSVVANAGANKTALNNLNVIEQNKIIQEIIALVAKQTKGNTFYYQILNNTDDIVKQAITNLQ